MHFNARIGKFGEIKEQGDREEIHGYVDLINREERWLVKWVDDRGLLSMEIRRGTGKGTGPLRGD